MASAMLCDVQDRMVQLLLHLTAASGRTHQVVEALCTQARAARRIPGCGGAHLSADVEVADAFWYREEWDDQAAFEATVRTDQFSRLLALMETSAREPAIEIRVAGELRGLDYVAALRAATADERRPR